MSEDLAGWFGAGCSHARTRLWVVVQGNGAECVRPICEDCCWVLPGIAKRQLGERVASLPRISHAEAAERRGEASNRQASLWREAHEAKKRREREAFFAEYGQYLRSPEWRSLRQRVMRRANGTCEACLIRPATQVHHRSYEHVFNEFAFELVAVCDACHARLHPREEDEAAA